MTGADACAGRRAGLPRVVHVTADFPDPVQPRKTEVIRSLIELTADRFDHAVISLNRRSPGLRALVRTRGRLATEEQPFAAGLAVTYGAPPSGILHFAMLEQLGEWLARRITSWGPRPDLIVGHKLTVEGIAAAVAARRLGIPYALSIQGNTDGKILALRPDLAPRLATIFHGARALFPFAPWALDVVTKRLGSPRCPVYLLPCPTELDRPIAPVAGRDGLVTAFHLRSWRTKNFDTLLRAYRTYRADGGGAPLGVVGGGDEAAVRACRALADGVAGVAFEGPLARGEVPARLNAAAALVVPSRSETFGLVFIEALFAGCPVVYPAGRAIDGYFDGAPFALRVDHRSTTSIAEAIAHAVKHQTAIKAALLEWQTSADADRFRRPAIAREFARGLEKAAGG